MTKPASVAREHDLPQLLLPSAAIVLAANWLGSTLFRGQWWGLHHLGFLGPAGMISLTIGAVASLAWLYRRRSPAERAAASPDAAPAPSPGFLDRPIVPIVAALVFAAIAWTFRIRHYFLGDGLPLVQQLPKGTNFHHRQPLTYALQQWWYRWNGGQVSAAPGPADEAEAGRIVALGSVVAGALFVIIAWYLARELVRRREGKRDVVDAAAAALVTALLLVQGYALLYFGYVENYTLVATVYAFYVLAGLRFLNGRWPLWPAAIAAILAGALHVSAAMLWPSLAVLIVLAWLGGRRGEAIIGFGAAAGTLAALAVLLGRLRPGYDWLSNVTLVGRVAVTGGEGGMYRGYLGTGSHARDFINEQFLIGPFGLWLLVAVVILVVRKRAPIRPAAWFLGMAALAWLAVSLSIGDTNLGYPRDWDVMAPGAFFFLVTALALLYGAPDLRPGRRFLLAALAVSLFQFVPWVMVNADERRALERIKLLPMTGARTEVMVANWYFRQGEMPLAEEWYRKALAAHPGSHVAQSSLAYLYTQQRRFPEAIALFEDAVAHRPDYVSYWQSLVSTLVMSGDMAGAATRLSDVVRRFPADEFSWMQYGQVLVQLGRYDEASVALNRALELNPANAEARSLRDQLNAAAPK